MRLDIANTDAPDGDYALAIETTGDLSTGSAPLPEKLTLDRRQAPDADRAADRADRGRRRHHDPARQCRRPDGRAGRCRCRFARPPCRSPPAWSSISARTAAACASTANCWPPACCDGAIVSVGVSPSAAFDVPSLLMALDRYPYGCAEQTTSRALPLLYVSELAAGAGMDDDPELQGAHPGRDLPRAQLPVLVRQLRPLGAGLRRPLARRLCHRLPDPRPRAELRRAGAGDGAGARQPAELARLRHRPRRIAAARSPMRSMCWRATRRPRSATCATMPTPSSKPSPARWPWRSSPPPGALRRRAALGGDLRRGAAAGQVDHATYDWHRSDYGSRLRDGAAMLALAAESRPMPADRARADQAASPPNATRSALDQHAGRGLDAACRPRAAGRQRGRHAARRQRQPTIPAPMPRRIDRRRSCVDSPIVIANTGSRRRCRRWSPRSPRRPSRCRPAATASPSSAPTTRSTASEANVTEVDAERALVVVLKVTRAQRLAVAHPGQRPAAGRLRDRQSRPRQQRRACRTSPGWRRPRRRISNSATTASSPPSTARATATATITLAYVVRAVTPGIYAHPAASVEDMYRPQFSARTATGMMEVKAP